MKWELGPSPDPSGLGLARCVANVYMRRVPPRAPQDATGGLGWDAKGHRHPPEGVTDVADVTPIRKGVHEPYIYPSRRRADLWRKRWFVGCFRCDMEYGPFRTSDVAQTFIVKYSRIYVCRGTID